MRYTEILDEYGVEYWEHGDHHHVAEGWLGLDCPACSPGSNKARLGINLATGGMSCWVCGRMNRIEVWAAVTGLSKRDAYKLLDGVQLIGEARVKRRGKLVLPDGLGRLLRPHREYLEGRGFDPDELSSMWGIQGTGRSSSLPWRLFIPIEEDDVALSWTTRQLHDNGGRYHNASPEQEIISSKELLYGSTHARHCAIICEGPTDVWRIGPGAVCGFGMSLTHPQVAKLARYPRRAICFDDSRAAQRQARRLYNTLSILEGETCIVTLDAEDPGSASEREIRRLRAALLGG